MGNGGKVLLVAILLGVAGWLYYRASAVDEVPDDPKRVTYWKCSDCDKVLTLTDRDYENQSQLTRKFESPGGDVSTVKPMGRAGVQLVLLCPNCNKVTCENAVKCKDDGEVYVHRKRDGTLNKCPKCGKTSGRAPMTEEEAERSEDS